MSTKSEILVLMTGGTICSTENEKGERYSDVKRVRIAEQFQQGDSVYAKKTKFDVLAPLNVLSENMTTGTWNRLLSCLRTQVDWTRYRGIVLLHGTDTLAYTASLLSIVLAGAPIPVCMVSSQLPLHHKETNGHANFKAAVELIMNGIAPNVYVVYRNMNGGMYVHFGAHLRQCPSYSNDFFSVDAVRLENTENATWAGKPFETGDFLLSDCKALSPDVLRLAAYVGMDYARLSLDGVRAVVHDTYHSESVCVERSRGEGEYSSASVLWLLDQCRKMEIPLFWSPCSAYAYQYESTGDALENGAIPLYGMTEEMAYVKVLIGCALGYQGEKLISFARKSVNHEFLC